MRVCGWQGAWRSRNFRQWLLHDTVYECNNYEHWRRSDHHQAAYGRLRVRDSLLQSAMPSCTRHQIESLGPPSVIWECIWAVQGHPLQFKELCVSCQQTWDPGVSTARSIAQLPTYVCIFDSHHLGLWKDRKCVEARFVRLVIAVGSAGNNQPTQCHYIKDQD